MGKVFTIFNFRKKDDISKGERLIYVVILLWAIYGIYGIMYNINLNQLAGYYASLTLFVSTYLWGEYKRTDQNTKLFHKGPNSSRELVIYITVFLWCLAGAAGIYFNYDLNSLTVYFSALSPFVISYIIYKTTKGSDLPIFDGNTQKLIDDAKAAADIKTMNKARSEIKKEEDKKAADLEQAKTEIKQENERSDAKIEEAKTQIRQENQITDDKVEEAKENIRNGDCNLEEPADKKPTGDKSVDDNQDADV